MSEEGPKALLEIPQVVDIIKKCGLISKMQIKIMLKIAQRNDISVNVLYNISIREDGRKQRDQISKYTILKNNAYYVHHNWNKNQKVRGKVVVPFPRYGFEGCGFKLFMQTFISKFPPKQRRSVEVNFDVIWSTIKVGKK